MLRDDIAELKRMLEKKGLSITDAMRASALCNKLAPHLIAANEAMEQALLKIAEVCNGYGNEAGWACKNAREALRKLEE